MVVEEWRRNTAWRQGAALHLRDLPGFEGAAHEWAVVITHDCDLANAPDIEPSVELIPAAALDNPDGNRQHGRNPRELDIELIITRDNPRSWFRLRASDKRGRTQLTVDKQVLARHSQPLGGVSSEGVSIE